MPHFTTFDNFASKAIVHPQFQEGSKAIVHPQFQEAAKAIVHPQFQPEAGRAIVHPQFQPEADGFMKLDDIRGEVSPSHQLVGEGIPCWTEFFKPTKSKGTNYGDMMTGIRDTDIASESLLPGTANRAVGGTAGPGGSTFSTGVDGLGEFGEEADVLTNVSYTTVRNGIWDDPTTWSGASASVISEACTPTCATGFAADTLVQQGNDFAGLINPDSMRTADFANNQVMFETGLPVEGIGASNPMGIEPNQMVGESFEPVIRNGYNCEDFGVCAG